jgi:hypothetical protein
VRHVSDGTLRRLVDEPFAVAERDIQHLKRCDRCRSRATQVERDARSARQLFSPVALSSPDVGWQRVHARATTTPAARAGRIGSRRRWRLMGASISTGTSIAAAGVLIAGVAAAATLTTVFAPKQVAPLPVSQADLQQLTSYLGTNGGELGGFPAPSGSKSLPFGEFSWSSSGQPDEVGSLADAEAAAGFATTLPSSLPNGVDAVAKYLVVPKVTATITFNASAGAKLSGSTLTMTVGPGIVVSYSGATGATGFANLPPLVVAAGRPPMATSTGATTTDLENFLLAQHGVPGDLAQELRFVGNLQTTLPVPTPPGVSSASMQIDGAPAVVLGDGSGTATGAIWEDHQGMLHIVAGLIDKGDLLGVARQVS